MACSRTRDLAVHLSKHCLQLTFGVHESTFYLAQEVPCINVLKSDDASRSMPNRAVCDRPLGSGCLKLFFMILWAQN